MIKNKNNKRIIVRIGFIAIWLFVLLELVTDIWFGSKLPGYDWKAESISYLGQAGSPIEQWVLIWGIFFSILITLFVLAFYKSFQSYKWTWLAAIALLVYGLGEGPGSGCFPINPPGTGLTMDSRLHNIFSGIGDVGIVILPFIFMLMFSSKTKHKLHIYLWSVVGIGLLMASFFLIAKYFRPDNFILYNKGVWQRLYIFNYYIMLLIISIKMVQNTY